MPDVATVEQMTKVVEGNPPAKLLRAVIQPESSLARERSYRDIQGIIRTHIEGTKKRFPKTSSEKIDAMFLPYFGPLLLPERTHLEGAQTVQEKELSARIQHSMVDNMFGATEPGASETYAKNMYDQARAMQQLCEYGSLGKNYSLLTFWNGVKAELAVVRALRKNQAFRVILPNYLQDTAQTSAFDNEVLQWDVKSGVDLIAIPADNPACAFLIDVKGRKQEPTEDDTIPAAEKDEKSSASVTSQKLSDVEFQKLNSCVKKELQQQGITTVYRLRLEVPTAGGYLGTVANLPKEPPDGNYKNSLEMFTALRPSIAENMRQQITILR